MSGLIVRSIFAVLIDPWPVIFRFGMSCMTLPSTSQQFPCQISRARPIALHSGSAEGPITTKNCDQQPHCRLLGNCQPVNGRLADHLLAAGEFQSNRLAQLLGVSISSQACPRDHSWPFPPGELVGTRLAMSLVQWRELAFHVCGR